VDKGSSTGERLEPRTEAQQNRVPAKNGKATNDSSTQPVYIIWFAEFRTMLSMFCALCAAPLVPGAPFCPNCGRSQPLPGPVAMGGPPQNWAPIPGSGSAPPGASEFPAALIAILVVVIVLFAAAFVFVLFLVAAGPGIGPGETPLGAVFAPGDPTLSRCPSNSTFASVGCGASDYRYNVRIVNVTGVLLSQVQFEVLTASGAVENGTGGLGFTVLNVSGDVVAQFETLDGVMTMSSGSWSYSPGISAATLLLNSDNIVIDIGPIDPLGDGFTFVAVGTNGITGTTSELALP
jgi:hypothetical protein